MEPWVLQRALQRQFMRTIGITNMLLVLCFIPIQAQSVQLLFSLMVSDFHPSAKTSSSPWRFFSLQASWCQVMEFRRVKTCLNTEGKKKSLHVTSGPQDTIACCWSEISGESKKPLIFAPWQLFTVDCLPLELWETFTSREIMRWLWNEACRYGVGIT